MLDSPLETAPARRSTLLELAVITSILAFEFLSMMA
jgi:hypothetical protein